MAKHFSIFISTAIRACILIAHTTGSKYDFIGFICGKKVYVTIDFLPDFSDDIFSCDDYKSLINLKLIECLDKGITYNTLKKYKFDITGYKGFDYAQVTGGGIDITEVNPRTMESNITKNLYFAGEILDVDGICGGYNLTFAISSGAVAGRNASIKND